MQQVLVYGTRICWCMQLFLGDEVDLMCLVKKNSRTYAILCFVGADARRQGFELVHVREREHGGAKLRNRPDVVGHVPIELRRRRPVFVHSVSV